MKVGGDLFQRLEEHLLVYLSKHVRQLRCKLASQLTYYDLPFFFGESPAQDILKTHRPDESVNITLHVLQRRRYLFSPLHSTALPELVFRVCYSRLVLVSSDIIIVLQHQLPVLIVLWPYQLLLNNDFDKSVNRPLKVCAHIAF